MARFIAASNVSIAVLTVASACLGASIGERLLARRLLIRALKV
jgi:hypothetical protein